MGFRCYSFVYNIQSVEHSHRDGSAVPYSENVRRGRGAAQPRKVLHMKTSTTRSLAVAAAFAGLLGGTTARMDAKNATQPGQLVPHPTCDKTVTHACRGKNCCKGMDRTGQNSCKGLGKCATDGSSGPPPKKK